MKYWYYIGLTLLLPILSKGQTWKTFTDTAGNFTATYPSTWVNKIKQGNRVFFTSPAASDSDKFLENINISVSAKKTGYGTTITVDSVAPSVLGNVKKEFIDFKDEGHRFFKWNGVNAVEIMYSGRPKTDSLLVIRSIQWFCFYKEKLYVVTFLAAADTNLHNETARKIMTGIIFK